MTDKSRELRLMIDGHVLDTMIVEDVDLDTGIITTVESIKAGIAVDSGDGIIPKKLGEAEKAIRKVLKRYGKLHISIDWADPPERKYYKDTWNDLINYILKEE